MFTFGKGLDGYHDVEDQFIDYLRRRAEHGFRRREREREAVKTRSDFEAYRARMHAHFLRAMGGLPKERTPLEAAVTGTLDRGTFRIEKVLYHSLPGFPVTANLYLPHARQGQPPGPAVLFVCGHSREAKAYPRYQQVCIDLALDGFVVLCIDPPGQGERLQFIDERTGLQRVGWGTTEHSYAGHQYELAGMSIARQFVWDGIRGLDYLLARPEVDPEKVGLTGNSGGGTQSCLLMLAEPRFAAAMPCTFVMDYESYLKTGQLQDSEQNLYASFQDGPDHDDYLTAMAPKPVRVGLAQYDFFPIEGALSSIEKARRFYALYGDGAQRALDYVSAPTTHAYAAVLRQAAVNFFRRTLRGAAEDFVTQEPPTLPPEELQVTPTGQVLSSFPECQTVSSLLKRSLDAGFPAPGRRCEPLALRTEWAAALGIGTEVPDGAASWSGEPRRRAIFPRVIRDDFADGYRTEKIWYFSEPDLCAAAIQIHPRAGQPVLGTELLLLEGGTAAIPDERGRLVELLERGRRVFVLDVRGVGALQSRRPRGESARDLEFKFGCDALKLKTSTLGLRVFDVLRAIDYLCLRPAAGSLALTGVGAGASWALHAAVLDPRVEALTLERLPLSLRAMATARFYDEASVDFRATAWGLLRVGDTLELLAALAPRPVTFLQPLGATGRPLEASVIEADFLKPAEAAGLIGARAGGWRPSFKGV